MGGSLYARKGLFSSIKEKIDAIGNFDGTKCAGAVVAADMVMVAVVVVVGIAILAVVAVWGGIVVVLK